MRSLLKINTTTKMKYALLSFVMMIPLAGVISATATGESQTKTETVIAAAVTTTTDPGPTQLEIDTLNKVIWQNELDRQAWNQAIWINKTNERIAAEEAKRIRKAEQAEAARKAAAEKAAAAPSTPAPQTQTQTQTPAIVPEQGTGRCGGDLPPCWVMMRESRGNIHAENPISSASGKWQFIDSTWAGFGGYSHASYAPESVQDAKARQLWAGGAGCGHWSAC